MFLARYLRRWYEFLGNVDGCWWISGDVLFLERLNAREIYAFRRPPVLGDHEGNPGVYSWKCGENERIFKELH